MCPSRLHVPSPACPAACTQWALSTTARGFAVPGLRCACRAAVAPAGRHARIPPEPSPEEAHAGRWPHPEQQARFHAAMPLCRPHHSRPCARCARCAAAGARDRRAAQAVHGRQGGRPGQISGELHNHHAGEQGGRVLSVLFVPCSACRAEKTGRARRAGGPGGWVEPPGSGRATPHQPRAALPEQSWPVPCTPPDCRLASPLHTPKLLLQAHMDSLKTGKTKYLLLFLVFGKCAGAHGLAEEARPQGRARPVKSRARRLAAIAKDHRGAPPVPVCCCGAAPLTRTLLA